MAPCHLCPRGVLGLLWAGLSAALASADSWDEVVGGRMLVVLEGSQGELDSQEALQGVQMGIMKSTNTDLKDKFDDVNFIFLEMESGGLFEHEHQHLLPLVRRHLELTGPFAVLSLGDRAAALVDNVTAELAVTSRPSWHYKCMQRHCPETNGSGVVEHETCIYFVPNPKDVLREVGQLKPAASKVILLNDGSSVAQGLARGLALLSESTRAMFCGGCIVEERHVTSAAEIQSLGLLPSEANSSFLLLPSMEGLNSTAADVWAALWSTQAGAFAPLEVVKLGGLAAFRVHPGSAAEECSVVVAQKTSLNGAKAYEVKNTSTYRLTMSMQRAEHVQGVEWYNGNLHHSGREMWDPVQRLWPNSQLAPPQKPKVLIVHSYGRAYTFADSEHKGFIHGLQHAGHSLDCGKSMHFCTGDLEVRTLYWQTKFWFQNASDIAIKAAYTKDYIRRWRPDVVYFTDDHVLNELVIPCFEPLTNGPNPSYDGCAGTQYVGAGINGDVRRIFSNKCLEYHADGTCARAPFFIEAGHGDACRDCKVGNEPECQHCVDLYDKARPVNITFHMEVPDTNSVVRMMRRVKPSVQKVVIFSDSTVTSHGWRDTIKWQFTAMQRDRTDEGIAMDFESDWHALDSQTDFLAKLKEYQVKPEYMVWIPSTLAFLPMDPVSRKAVWDEFLELNKLGEVLAPGETDGALLGAAGHPDSMGRVIAQYASLIVRGSVQASKLPILTTPLSKVFVNVGRALQLHGHGILPIPEDILARADHIFALCPPGKWMKDSHCAPCPAQTFKSTFGDSQRYCLPCPNANPNAIGLDSCPVVERHVSDIGWLVGILLVSFMVALLVVTTWHLRKRANSVWIIDERELDYGPGPVTVLGQGTFGKVVKAEYRGTMVAVKRVLPPPPNGGKFDWETRTMAFERNVSCSSPSIAYTESNSGSTDPSDLEAGIGGVPRCITRFNCVEGARTLPMQFNEPFGFRTVRRLKEPSSGRLTQAISTWRQHNRLKKDFIREMRVVSQLRHPCVTTVMGAIMSSSAEPALVMELMENGSLYGMLHNDTVVIENEIAIPILCDIAHGIRFLHAANPCIVHGDIKSQNVLIDSKYRAKVCDFGLSQKKQVGACGTPFWMAPELLQGGSITPASDIYAFGILLNEVCTRQDPYFGEDARQVLAAVVKDNKRPTVPCTCCSNMEVMMTECWRANPESRPPAQEIDQRLRRLLDQGASSPLAVLAPPSRMLQKAYEFNDDDDRTNDLLYDVFPRHVADQLRAGKKVEPESREIVTIFFSDIVGFTDISSTIEPRKISNMLDRLYTKFDALSREHQVFKVETIGDAYMAVSNLAEDQAEDHAKRIADFAIAAVKAANETLIDEEDLDKGYLNIRVGFHSGPVVANVVGTRNLRYCLFGDTVNTASRMESNSIKNHIHCSAWAARILKEQAPGMRVIRRGIISVKGKGEMETFWVAKEPRSLSGSLVM